MPTVIVKQAASNKMQFEQCELMECQESLFSQTTQFLLVSRICHSKEQAFYLLSGCSPNKVFLLQQNKNDARPWWITLQQCSISTQSIQHKQKLATVKKNGEREREGKTRLLLERTPIARTLFGSLIFRWNLKGGTGAKWISIIKWRECTTVAKIFGTVYGVEPCKLFSWWKAPFIHAERIKSRVIVKMVPCFAEPWRVAKSWHWGTCNRFFKKYTLFLEIIRCCRGFCSDWL